VMALKLAGAIYLPEGSMLVSNQDVRGYSLEVALEGALYAATSAAVGSSARLHLSTGTPAKLTAWGADDSTTPQRREYQNGTGTGILLGDVQSALFPGWVEGEVVENSGSTLFVRVTEMDLATAKWSGTVQRVALLPDHESAEEAGLPAGTFGCLEVNYSGLPTESLIVPQVTSNDVEIHAIAEPRRARFLRGDCNGDGDAATGIAEAIFFLLYSFQGGEKPPCFAACDFDGDGDVFTQVTDIIYLLRHYFMGGDPLPPPYPECGVEPEPSTVSCDTEPGCG